MIVMSRLRLALLLAHFSGAVWAQNCSGPDAALAESIGFYLRWSDFWNAERGYPLKKRVALDLSISEGTVRYCSQQVKLCAHSERGSDGLLGRGWSGIDLRRSQDPNAEARRYLMEHTPSPASRVRDAIAEGNVFRGEDGTVRVPVSKEGLFDPHAKLRRCRYELPPVANITPPSILQKTMPSTWPLLKAALEQAVKDKAAEGWRVRYIVPYYSDADPMVYVIVEANGERSHVDMMELQDGKWKLRGPLVPIYEPVGFGRFCDRIEAARMATVPE